MTKAQALNILLKMIHLMFIQSMGFFSPLPFGTNVYSRSWLGTEVQFVATEETWVNVSNTMGPNSEPGLRKVKR